MKTKVVYSYDPSTKIFAGEQISMLDPRATERTGSDVYMMPANCVSFPPAFDLLKEGYIFILNDSMKDWKLIKDQYNVVLYNKENKSTICPQSHGPIPSTYTEIQPDGILAPYLIWSDDKGTWVFNTEKREELLAALWEKRKSIREAACSADLEYNGHLFHVDASSFNDLLLAYQEAALEDAATYSKRWVTADSVDVALTAADLLAILKAYGARRQQLVYESNEAWQEDVKLTNEALVELYSTMIKGE